MNYIEMHAHMVSRTTDDYHDMALAGCVAVTEPAFWAGFDRGYADSFDTYFMQLTEFEPARAAKFGIAHYTWLCLNPKEGDDRELSREVLRRIPKYLSRSNVVGIGEIGLNKVTRNELETFKDHVELAMRHDQLILIHTPHLEDKYKGSKLILDTLLEDKRVQPERVLIDHAEEHTIGPLLDAGFWIGITLYPQTKTSYARAADMIETHGPERICVNAACDWGPSVPLAVPNLALELRQRGHSRDFVQQVVYENPKAFLRQSPNFTSPD